MKILEHPNDAPPLVDFSLTDPGIQADPYPLYDWLLQNAPVCRASAGRETHWVFTRHKDVLSIVQQPQMFSSATVPIKRLVSIDPPDHTRIRKTVAAVFTPRAINVLEEQIRTLARELYLPLLAQGGGDVVDTFANPLPVKVIGALVGVPTDKHRELREWSDLSLRLLGTYRGLPPDERAVEGRKKLLEYIGSLLEKYKREPNGTIASNLIQLTRDGIMSEEEVLVFCAFLFSAGHETTMSLLAGGMEVMARMPHILERIKAEPRLIPAMVEEVLRYHPPLQRMTRRALADVEISGHHIPAGSYVRLFVGAANRDPAVFEEPHAFRLDRAHNPHISFGTGIHVCLGATLARLEGRVAFELIAETTQQLSVDAGRESIPTTGGSTSEYGKKQFYMHLTRH